MKPTTTLAIAAASLLLPFSARAQASSTDSAAMHLVRAQGALVESIDADKTQAGQEVEVKLSETARLDDGTKLPSGTILVGNIAQDDLNINGQSKVALRFTQAKLKDGSVIPIKATIVGVRSRADDPGTQDNRIMAGWNDGIAGVDAVSAFPHVDLHSKVASDNSGVFVSTDKDDVKLKAGSEFGLAIAAVK